MGDSLPTPGPSSGQLDKSKPVFWIAKNVVKVGVRRIVSLRKYTSYFCSRLKKCVILSLLQQMYKMQLPNGGRETRVLNPTPDEDYDIEKALAFVESKDEVKKPSEVSTELNPTKKKKKSKKLGKNAEKQESSSSLSRIQDKDLALPDAPKRVSKLELFAEKSGFELTLNRVGAGKGHDGRDVASRASVKAILESFQLPPVPDCISQSNISDGVAWMDERKY